MDKAQIAAVRQFLLQTLEVETATTKRVIEALPDAHHDYRPDPKSKSGHELAWHIAASEIWFLEGILRGEFTGQQMPQPRSEMRSKEIVEWYAAELGKVFPKLKAMSEESAAKPVSFFGMATLPAVFFVSWATNHSIHHRGQLSTYIRPMGGRVPNIYGGSADEPLKM